MNAFNVSVVIPAFNAENHLPLAIASASALGATEIVVVDDGSTDRTSEIASSLGCVVISQSNAGAAAARRAGINVVTGDFTLLLDADDAILSDGTLESLSRLVADQTLVGVIGATVARSASGETKMMRPWDEGVSVTSLLRRGFAPGPPAAFVWRTSLLRNAFAPEKKWLAPLYAEDYELVIQAALQGEIATHDAPVCDYAMAGGKSAVAPIKSNRAAEDIRRFYSRRLDIPIIERPQAELVSMAYFRTAYSRVGRKQLPSRIWWLARAVFRAPWFAIRLVARRGSKVRDGILFAFKQARTRA